MSNELGTWGVVTDPYVPPLLGPKYNLPRCGCVTSGSGVPDNSSGDDWDVYIDTSTEFAYQRQDGVYVQITAGASGGDQQVYQYAGDPNGNVLVTTTKPCFCIDTTNHIGWVKVDGLKTNTGWTAP